MLLPPGRIVKSSGCLRGPVVRPTVAAMRLCTKTACPREAAASCAFNYADRHVWIVPLHRDRDPSFYDLCEDHLESLRVPNGWSLEDRRSAADAGLSA